jgi:uncharacterized repeat protein (TIGR03803 family)
LFGTTPAGGFTYCSAEGCGTLFKVTPSGALVTIYRFCSQPNCSDGVIPSGTLVQAANGDLYGTTQEGGIANVTCFLGSCGTIFKLTPSGTLTTL